MIYKFRRDWKVILVSALAVVAIPIVLCVAWFVEGDVEALIAMPLWLLLMAGVILRTPRYFYIEKDVIIVKYHIGRKVLADIESVRCVTREELRGATRLYGNSGFMAYSGWFRSADLGKFYMDAVNKDELALVTLANGKKYVINYPRELLKKKNDKIVSC